MKQHWDEIDIRKWKQRTRIELTDEIIEALRGTQAVLKRRYPHRLRMTEEQYNILKGVPPDDPIEIDWRLFYTHDAVLEIFLENEPDEEGNSPDETRQNSNAHTTARRDDKSGN